MKPKQWCNACLLTGRWDSLSLATVLLAPQQVLDTLFAFSSKADEGGKQSNTEAVCSLRQHSLQLHTLRWNWFITNRKTSLLMILFLYIKKSEICVLFFMNEVQH